MCFHRELLTKITKENLGGVFYPWIVDGRKTINVPEECVRYLQSKENVGAGITHFAIVTEVNTIGRTIGNFFMKLDEIRGHAVPSRLFHKLADAEEWIAKQKKKRVKPNRLFAIFNIFRENGRLAVEIQKYDEPTILIPLDTNIEPPELYFNVIAFFFRKYLLNEGPIDADTERESNAFLNYTKRAVRIKTNTEYLCKLLYWVNRGRGWEVQNRSVRRSIGRELRTIAKLVPAKTPFRKNPRIIANQGIELTLGGNTAVNFLFALLHSLEKDSYEICMGFYNDIRPPFQIRLLFEAKMKEYNSTFSLYREPDLVAKIRAIIHRRLW